MTASKLIRRQEQHLMTEWDSARRFLRMPTESTRFVYTHPSNNLWWDLSGRFKGRQGARLSNEVQGMYHLPVDRRCESVVGQADADRDVDRPS
jgi:hypothetical protein